jgi:FkbM family methyltransferase
MIPSGIVHIGANSGQEVADYKESAIRPVILVEPLEDPFRRLVASVAGEKDFFPIQACLSNQSGREVEFHVASNGGQASSYYAPGNHLDLYPQVKFDQSIKLVTRTLDELLSELSDLVDTSLLDYISLDTQGAELDILRGASGS